MYVTESKVNQQNIVINKLLCPQGVNLAGSPNIVPDIGSLAYDVGSSVLYYGDGAVWTPLAANTGSPISISNFGSSPNLKGLTLMGSVLNLEPASSTFPGGVSITAQTISGVKTFNDSVILPSLSSTGIVHNDAGGNLSTSLIVNSDISLSAAISDNKLNPISTTGKVLNSATTATSSSTPNTIVLRDGSNNFSAGTITANVIGNLTGNATSSTSFSGNLAGDVTGPQSNTVVAQVSSVAASLIASGATLANAATNISTPNTLVKRDGSGGFSAGTIIGSFTGNLAGNATTANSATNFSGILLGDVTGTQSSTVVSQVGALSAALVASGATLANNSSTSTAGTIVRRDGSGDFSARIVTATTFIGNLTGNVTGNASSSTNSISFSGPLLGDVTGNQSATIVSFVSGLSAALTAAGATLANNSTSSNTGSAIVRRDGSGNFAASVITNTDLTSSGVINLLDTTSSTVGVINKGGSRFLHNYGNNNTFLGKLAGNFGITGFDCTGVGTNALMSKTSGDSCSAFGHNCMSLVTSGINNNAFGVRALNSVTVTSNSSAFGHEALALNTADSMTAFGAFALGSNTTGARSSAFGVTALESNVTGNDCTAFGFQALRFCTASFNIGIGSNAGQNITNTIGNICIGNQGVTGDVGVMRYGTAGTHQKNFQAGIVGVTADLSDSIPVYVSSTGQLTTVTSQVNPSGTMYVTGSGSTAIAAATWTALTSFTLSTTLSNFTRSADNRLRYDGAQTIRAMAIASVNISSSATTTVIVAITKNGASPPNQAGVLGPLSMTAGVNANFTSSGMFSLATNDYLSVWVNTGGATTITSNYATLSVMG